MVEAEVGNHNAASQWQETQACNLHQDTLFYYRTSWII